MPARYASVVGLLDRDTLKEPSTVSGVIRGFATSALLGYASTACVMPFEVGKTLMQVQWIPKADVELLNESEVDENAFHHFLGEETEVDKVIYDVDDLSDEDDAQAYFQDLNNSHGSSQGSGRRSRTTSNRTGEEVRRKRPPLDAPSLSVTRARDASGYIVRRSIFEHSTKPDWVLPFTVTGGVWDMMKAIGRWKGEGWLSLWKGQLLISMHA